MIDDALLAQDVRLLRRAFQYLKRLEPTRDAALRDLISSCQDRLTVLCPGDNHPPSNGSGGYCCPHCGGTVHFLYEVLQCTATDIDSQTGQLVWATEHLTDHFYTPAFRAVSVGAVCLTCSADVDPTRFVLPRLSAAQESGSQPLDLTNRFLAGLGTLDLLLCAELLQRIHGFLDQQSREDPNEGAVKLRSEVAARVEELYPSTPVLSEEIARFLSCSSCGGRLQMLRQSIECTAIAIDPSTGQLVGGSAQLTDQFHGKPMFQVYNAVVACASCGQEAEQISYSPYGARILVRCTICEAEVPPSELQGVVVNAQGKRYPICRTECNAKLQTRGEL